MGGIIHIGHTAAKVLRSDVAGPPHHPSVFEFLFGGYTYKYPRPYVRRDEGVPATWVVRITGELHGLESSNTDNLVIDSSLHGAMVRCSFRLFRVKVSLLKSKPDDYT